MNLIGYSQNVSGTTLDLSLIGTNEFHKRKEGLSYAYDLDTGEEKTKRKGNRKIRGSLTGNNYLNYLNPTLGWTDPQPTLDSMDDFAGEVAELQWNHGGTLGHWIVEKVEVRYRELRDPANSTGEDFKAFDYTLDLLETEV